MGEDFGGCAKEFRLQRIMVIWFFIPKLAYTDGQMFVCTSGSLATPASVHMVLLDRRRGDDTYVLRTLPPGSLTVDGGAHVGALT